MDTAATSRAPLRVAVCGSTGRVGGRICALAREDERFLLAASLSRRTGPPVEVPELDLVLDFSSDEGTRAAVKLSRATSAALLVGTTGLSRESLGAVEDLARLRPVMIAPNTSFGITVLTQLAVLAARLCARLDPCDVDILETHRRGKRDRPSGTAIRLAEALVKDAGRPVPDDRVHSLRAGDAVGEHSVIFSLDGERIVLRHEATSRDLFARGALRAGAWLVRQAPGTYRIEQALAPPPPPGP